MNSRPKSINYWNTDFIGVNKPEGDYFFGPDTKHLKERKWYDERVANDHTFTKAEDGK